jgi:hypothetical protein
MDPSSESQRINGALRFLAELDSLTVAAVSQSPVDELAPRRRRFERVRRTATGREERRVKAL